MTPSEFKAWFGGFTEALDDRPSDEQWKRIKARVAEIDGQPVTERIYVDRYLPYYSRGPYNHPNYFWGAPPYVYAGNAFTLNGTNTVTGTGQQTTSFNSQTAMLALGRAEAQSLN